MVARPAFRPGLGVYRVGRVGGGMTDDLDRIIAGLSEASNGALRTCDPWDVQVGAGAAVALICAELLQDSI
ncbi:hypothetical protein DD902_13170, partial [Staphylococcus pseudintermedius]